MPGASRLLCLALPLVTPALHAVTPRPSGPAVAPAPSVAAPQPVRGEWAALSPDGRLVAYSVRAGRTVSVVVARVAAPTQVLTRMVVAQTAAVLPGAAHLDAPPIAWMRWVSPQRIVVATDSNQRTQSARPEAGPVSSERFPPPQPSLTLDREAAQRMWDSSENFQSIHAEGFVFAFNADGSNARTLISPARAGSSVKVIGISPRAPDRVVVAAGYSHFTINVNTGRMHPAASWTVAAARKAEAARAERGLAVRAAAKAKLAQLIPGAGLAGVDVDAACDRLLAYGPSDKAGGGVYVYDPKASTVLAFVGSHH